MKKLTLLFIITMVSVLIAGTVYAGSSCGGDICDVEKGTDMAASEGMINTACPVMEGEVKADTLHVAMYDGKKIGFCCAECVVAFEKDPEKYMST